MKEGWEMKIFDDVISSSLIGLVRNNKEQSPEFLYRYFKMNNIKNDNGLNEESMTFVNATDDEVEKYRLRDNDFLFNTRNSFELVGKSCLYKSDYKGPTLFNNNILRVTFKEILSPQFAAYAFSTAGIKEELEKMKSGTTSVVGIYYKSLKNLKLPIPPLPEQKQIVAILDQAFAAIDQAKANIEKNIQNAKELFQSKLNEIFSQKGEGWEEKKFGDIARYDKSKRTKSNLPYVGLEHIESNTGKFIGTYNPVEVKSSTFQFDERHILYGRLRPYLNKVITTYFEGHCSTEIFPILPNNSVDREYLFFWFLTPLTVDKIDATCTGARMPRANMNEVINFKLPIPSLAVQKEVVKTLKRLKDKVEELDINLNNKLVDIDELKKSILQKVFEGELTEKELVA